MKFKTKFLGTPKKFDQLVPGDVFFAESYDRRFLVFMGSNEGESHFTVLGRWPGGAPSEYPHELTETVLSGNLLRVLTDELVLEPVGESEGSEFHPKVIQPHSCNNGNILVLSDGTHVLRINGQSAAYHWNLRDGQLVDVSAVQRALLISRWRLVWVDGDDRVTLCEIGVPKR